MCPTEKGMQIIPIRKQAEFMLCKLHCISRHASVGDLPMMFQNKSVGVIERRGKI